MQNKRLLIFLGGIVILSLFLLLNFRLAMSLDQSTKFMVTTDTKDQMPLAMQRNDKISMVLVGERPLVRALQVSLMHKLDQAGIGEIELAQDLEPAYPNPVLVVKVGKPGPLWTPFFAASQFPIHTGYTSDGDPTFMEVIEETRTSVGKKDVAFMYAEFEVSDLSLGLISRPGYHRFLAESLAEEIVTALKGMYGI